VLNKRFITNDEFAEMSFTLAQMVIDVTHVFDVDVIVGVCRGGAVPSIIVHEALSVKSTHNIKYCPIVSKAYDDKNHIGKNVQVTGVSEMASVVGKNSNILIVDDIFDTGISVNAIIESIHKYIPNATIKVATVYYKVNSNRTQRVPDYYAQVVIDDWLVFPHEVYGLTREELSIYRPKLL
jgi:hypothetical protein